MNSIRTAATLVILAVIVTGISMANKPNDKDGDNITVSPSTLVLSRYFADVTVHSDIPRVTVVDSSVQLHSFIMTEIGVVYLGSIEPDAVGSDTLGHLVAKFDDQKVKNIVESGEIGFVLTWDSNMQDSFTSNPDTIMVKE